ncbi:MAG: hypothetical protein LKF01_05655 [Lactobacillus sp.]|jgi:hypothetical protein|nr:hypothetical protein [Lactobacillus sp.]MCH4068956.1 hypothetical protein [Lactobacillus sp.]MCI1303358.1 hypothetical protein [Lactobacillus sp.]MCI1329434.1 hypothetical protein [Lactobacillus sp.]MCI1359614.1 hypothetical protein [Lactobacillus sp.]
MKQKNLIITFIPSLLAFSLLGNTTTPAMAVSNSTSSKTVKTNQDQKVPLVKNNSIGMGYYQDPIKSLKQELVGRL